MTMRRICEWKLLLIKVEKMHLAQLLCPLQPCLMVGRSNSQKTSLSISKFAFLRIWIKDVRKLVEKKNVAAVWHPRVKHLSLTKASDDDDETALEEPTVDFCHFETCFVGGNATFLLEFVSCHHYVTLSPLSQSTVTNKKKTTSWIKF